LEDGCLWLIGVPLRPWDPETILPIRVQLIGKPDNIILQFTPITEGVEEVCPMGL